MKLSIEKLEIGCESLIQDEDIKETDMNLNSEQRRVVESPFNKNMIILAGAGSGKTSIIIERINYLLENSHALPEQILIITFTAAAAKSLVARLETRTRISKSRFHIGTFHKVALFILRQSESYLHICDRTKNFSIISQRQKYNIILSILAEYTRVHDIMEIYRTASEEDRTLFMLSELISAFKTDRYQNQDRFTFTVTVIGWLGDKKTKNIFPWILESYETELKLTNALDFDDIITFSDKILQLETMKNTYQNLFKYVFIDEFQDIAAHQYTWLSRFMNENTYFLSVADDDQSIYDFRGAGSEYLAQLNRDLSNVETIQIVQNYRNGFRILEAANAVIKNNDNRLKTKIPWTAQKNGGSVTFKNYNTEQEEAQTVSKNIRTLLNHGVQISEIAILCRCHYQIPILAQHLESDGIEYYIKRAFSEGSKSLPEVINIFIDYLNFIIDPWSNECFKKICNKPSRGIGKKALEKLENHSHSSSMLANLLHLYQKSRNKKVICFINWIKVILFDCTSVKTINDIYNQMEQYLSFKEQDWSIVTSYLEEFNTLQLKSDPVDDNINRFFLFCKDKENKLNQNMNRITISTLHSAKGLEFEHVFLIGLVDEIFLPKQVWAHTYHSVHTKKEIQEERRLFYVGMTRAKHGLYLSCGLNAHPLLGFSNEAYRCRGAIYHQLRFISEIPLEFLAIDPDAILKDI